MTRYEELKAQLNEEGQKVMDEFAEKVRDGDIVRFKGDLGVIIKDSFSTYRHYNFLPLILGGIDTGNPNQVPYSTEITIDNIEHIQFYHGVEQLEFQKFIQAKIKESQEIPF